MIIEKGTLPVGLEIGGKVHRDYELRPMKVKDLDAQSVALDNPSALYSDCFVFGLRLTKLGDLNLDAMRKREGGTKELADMLHDELWKTTSTNSMRQGSGSKKVERAERNAATHVQIVALMAHLGYKPEAVEEMTPERVESLIRSHYRLRGGRGRDAGGSTTQRFVAKRRKKN